MAGVEGYVESGCFQVSDADLRVRSIPQCGEECERVSDLRIGDCCGDLCEADADHVTEVGLNTRGVTSFRNSQYKTRTAPRHFVSLHTVVHGVAPGADEISLQPDFCAGLHKIRINALCIMGFGDAQSN
jgi:hypothetical protein